MDLLKTILVYMTLVFVSSVQNAPEPTIPPEITLAPTVTATATASLAPTPSYTPVPTPDITPNPEYKTLRVGDKGRNVKQLQIRLQELGYYQGQIDSGFGGQTRKAVERFQYQNGLNVDGIAGKHTLTVLYEFENVVKAPAETPAPSVTLAPTDTPTPPPTDTPSLEETPIPTFAPPVESPSPSPSPTAKLIASELTVQTDCELWLKDGTQALQNLDGQALHPAISKDGASDLIPLMDLLTAANIMVVPSEAEGMSEFAFMLDEENVYYLAYRLDEAGNVTDLTLDLNRGALTAEPQAVMIGGTLYLPSERLTDTLGIACERSQDTPNRIVITLPQTAQP